MPNLIPVIDLGLVRDGRAPREVLDAIRTAGEEIGVIQVVNHGVPLSLIAEHDRRTSDLLARSRDVKAELASPTGHPYRGWRQWPDDLGRLELERFMFARFDSVDDAIAAGVDPVIAADQYEHTNVWPADDPNYRDLALTYRAEIVALAERVLALFAQALDVPADAFASVGPDTTSVTFNKYPTWTWPDDATDEDKLLLLEHADGNAITILYQDGDYAGLQVQQPDGEWQPVPIIEGALQVFFGGLIPVWTNDRWVPGRHRVVSGGAAVRHSTAIFYSPGFETVIAPIPELLEPGEEPSYSAGTIYERGKGYIDDYLRVFARPAQLDAWANRSRYVADVRESPASVG
ncbi:MAG: Dioxygenase, isopenicillin synthase [Ilumatobacteraceae bacterium]|nr:Dioxygenase, isopenicillin synthase [Ilumatobacteraceae bacterium]